MGACQDRLGEQFGISGKAEDVIQGPTGGPWSMYLAHTV